MRPLRYPPVHGRSRMMRLSSYKITLLRVAAGKGIGAFCHLLFLSLRDALFEQKHIVFCLSGNAIDLCGRCHVEGVTFQRFHTWDEVGERIKADIAQAAKSVWWGSPDWFDRGWQLWVGKVEGSLGVLSWSRDDKHSSGFFCPVPPRSMVIWQTVTLPDFRGRHLYSAMLAHVVETKAREGFERFYISCRDYNMSSRAGIRRVGFERIGCARVRKWSKLSIWVPERAPR